MEINRTLIGTRLNQIQKLPDVIKLSFEDLKTGKRYLLSFNGLLFETSGSALNRRVKNIQLDTALGILVIHQLRYLNRNTGNYRQLYIEMEGSNEENKLELIGALRTFKIYRKRKAVPKKSAYKIKKKISKV